MKVALAQISPKLSKDNVELHIKYIDQAISQNQTIILFPELSLNGYMLQDAVKEDFFTLEEFDIHYDIFAQRSLYIDIILGCVLKVQNRYYNSAIYFSQGKIAHIHHKNILPNYGMFEEARFFDDGDDFVAFETEYGKSIILICEDIWSKDVFEMIVKSDINNVFILSASPARGFVSTGLEIETKWDKILQKLSTNKKVFFTNRVGFEDGMGFWGGSRAYDNQKLISKASLFDIELITK